MKIDKIKERINELIELADRVISTSETSEYSAGSSVNSELFREFRTSSLSFLKDTFGESHLYYVEFKNEVYDSYTSHSQEGRGILKAVKQEIDGGSLPGKASSVQKPLATPEKVTLRWLFNHVPFRIWAMLIGFLIAAFTFGALATAKLSFVQEWFDIKVEEIVK